MSYVCIVCREPIGEVPDEDGLYEEPHAWHGPNCPALTEGDVECDRVDSDCGEDCHEACCPTCALAARLPHPAVDTEQEIG